MIHSEPGVWDFLVVAGKASPPTDALPASEAASVDRVAPLGGFRARHAAGELLQRCAQRHEGFHFQDVFNALKVYRKIFALLYDRVGSRVCVGEKKTLSQSEKIQSQ